MQSRMKRWLRGGFRLPTLVIPFAVLTAALVCAPAFAEEEEASPTPVEQDSSSAQPEADTAESTGTDANEDGADLWVPSLTAGFVLHVQEQDAGVFSGLGSGSQGTSDSMVSPGFRFDASIATPVIYESDWKPRLFAHLGTQIILEEKFTAYRSIASASFPPQSIAEIFATCGQFTQNCTVETRIESKINSQWYLGTGVEFVVPLWQRQVRLRTAVDYLGQSLSMSGTSSVLLRAGPGSPATEENYITGNPSTKTHSLGVNLQADAQVYEWRDLRVGLFLETRFTWMLSGDQVLLESRLDGTGPVGTVFSIEPDRFIAQGGGGIRLSWLPKWTW